MDDACEFLKGWHDLDDFLRRLCAEHLREGGLPPSLAISFVGDRPDLLVQMPTVTVEDADDIVDTLIDLFGAIRPERLAVVWPNRFEDEETGEVFWGVRVNSVHQPLDATWVWRTRVLACRHDPGTGEVEWADPIELDDPVDPWSRRLRRLYEPATYARLRARGWFVVPGDEDGWWCAAHPDSRTLAGLELLYRGHPRELSERERLRLGRRPAGAPRRGSHRPAPRPRGARRPGRASRQKRLARRRRGRYKG